MSSDHSSQHDGESAKHGVTEEEREHTGDLIPSVQNREQAESSTRFSIPDDASPVSDSACSGDNVEQINSDSYASDCVKAKASFSEGEDNVEVQNEISGALDNVGHEVRQYSPKELVASSMNDFVVLEDEEGAFSQNDGSNVKESSVHVPHDAPTVTSTLKNPSQGVQAEDISPPEAGSLNDSSMIEVENIGKNTTENLKSFDEHTTPINDGLSAHSLSVLRSLSASINISNRGLVDITLTFYPMGFYTRFTHPVYNASAFSEEGIRILSECRDFHSSGNERKEWILIARDLFEVVARHICVHPQSFVVYHQDKCIRFNSLMFLETERGRDTVREDFSTGAPSEVEHSAVVVRTEPLWLSIMFSDTARGVPKCVTDSEVFSFSDNQFVSEGSPDSCNPQIHAGSLPFTTSSLANVPPHLAAIQKDEFLAKCILVRKEKIEIDPHVLVEGRRQGFTYDEVIKSIYKHERGVAGNQALMTAVSIVQAPTLHPKPFLGGYRVKQDPKRVFLHASTQIFMADLDYSPHGGKKRAQFILNELKSRQTQSYGKSRSTQTRREGCAQTPRPDLFLDNKYDVLVVARPYFSAEALLKLRIEKIIMIQKMYRQWKARQICRDLYAAETERQLRTAARQRIEEAAVRARADLEKLRRMNPHRANDFGVLKEELLLWRSNKAKTITQDESLSAEQKREALLALTKEEVKLLQDLELHRQAVQQDKQGQQLVRILEKAASAKIWGGVPVTTPGTLRAAELRDLFYSLTNNDYDASSRMDVLLHIKWTVKEFPDSNESKELCQLIDREADLINRGWKSASLIELRKRITNIFRNFILDPVYNPEMARYNDSSIARQRAETLGRDSIASG